MANKIIVKRSSVAGKVPVAADLDVGELAVNVTDQKLYTKNASGTVVQLGGGSGTGDVVGPASATNNAIARYDGTTGKLIKNSATTIDDNGNLSGVNGVSLNTTPTSAPTAAGSFFWDSGDGTPSVILNANTSLQLGQENIAKVYNGTGSTINKGQVVAVSGAQGQRPSVVLADADTEALSAPTLGIAAESIANGAEGFVCTFGLVRGIDTSAFTAGQPIYLSSTAGAFTATKPVAPQHIVALGWVIKVNASSGEIFVNINNGWELDELHNVLITSAASGNTLIYDATAGVWKNANLTAGTGVSVTNGAGSITLANTGVLGVTGTSPVVSSGGQNPAISLASGYGDTQNPYASKTANFFLAAPNGTAGAPTFRAIVAADVPTLNQNTTGTASNVTGTVAIANGGTGQTTQQAALNALAGATTSGSYLRGNGTNVSMSPIQAADVPTLNQNTTGTASNVTGTVAIANGGTGQTTKTSAFDALAPSTTLGDTIYYDGADNVRLAGNTTTTKQFLSQTGTGTVSAAPSWSTVTKSDVGLANVENTALSTWAGSTNLTTLGTIATGTWNANTIGVTKGGTGLTSIAALSIPVANSANTYTTVTPAAGQSVRVNAGNTAWEAYTPATGTVTSVAGTGTVSGLTLSGTVTTSGNITLGGTLSVLPSNFASQTANTFLAAPNGVAGTPTFRTIVAADVPTLNQNTTGTASNVTGTVAIANGGTGATTAAAALANLGAYPSTNPNGYNTGTVTSITAGTGLSGGTITTSGTISLANTTVTAGSYTSANITVDAQGRITSASNGGGTATTATNLAGGAASQIPYQTGSGSTSFIANGTAGQFLRSNGTSAPTWANVVYNASYLIIAGGGGGGAATGGRGGGGGAGGVLTGSYAMNVGTTYSFVVGGGGAGGSGALNSTSVGISGSNSTAFGLTAIGGGGGQGGDTVSTAQSGGSGGGAHYNGAPGSGTAGQGNSGGSGTTAANFGSGGGGGWGAVGGNGSGSNGGNGGAGSTSSITGTSTTYAGGGGGQISSGTGGTGGSGGGGNGGNPGGGSAGTANTGGGGGGRGDGTAGWSGGSGVVIISVPTANYSGTYTGSPTITTSGSNTILKFTASGSYTA